ncbi:sulfotransferase [Chondrinema litorale]|uniref:sulfotransferase n=1 Tax=Chondrinema litorale TaxID=2994555 RepID=UPI002542F745|nr:sulfotransferase [Chondrinema litorale]UZS00188.1 sulfotransferase [Chondrinema litorale]
MEVKNKKIIYIIGTGRSGTTLLEILLGNANNIFNAGELNRYPKRKGIPPQHAIDAPTYQFWNKVGQSLKLSANELREQELLHYKFEYHSGLLTRLIGIKKNTFYKYQQFLRSFYQSIFDEIDESIITDSSKYPGRALNISQSLPYDIYYVYIKRNPVSVVRSFAKKDIEQPSKKWLPANLYYFSVNLLCQIVVNKLQKKHRVVEVTYEDLINYPEKLLKHIEEKLGLDLSSAINKLQDNTPLYTGKLFDGNRIRMKKEIYLRSDFKKLDYTFRDNLTRAINYLIYH